MGGAAVWGGGAVTLFGRAVGDDGADWESPAADLRMYEQQPGTPIY